MQPNEVRLGNFMHASLRSSHDKDVSVIKICAVSLTNIKGIKKGTKPLKYATRRYYDIKPIPLTEEWLLKFGFDKDEEWYSKGHLHYNIESNYFYSGNDHVSGGNSDATIKYVHQLQNLYFALTGEELILNH